MSRKTIKLPQPEPQESVFAERVSLEELQAIWNDGEATYTEDELLKIREWLYAIAEVIINTTYSTRAKIIPLNPNSHEAAQSHSLHPCKYGRTG